MLRKSTLRESQMRCSCKQSFHCTARSLYMLWVPFAPVIRST